MIAIQKKHTVNKSQDQILKIPSIKNPQYHDKFMSLTGTEFVCVINKHGRIEEIISKNEMNMTKEKKEMLTMGIQLQNSMQRDFDEEFGTVCYNITERENARFVSIPVYTGILLAKLDKSIDPFLFIDKITGILNSSKGLLKTCNGVCQ